MGIQDRYLYPSFDGSSSRVFNICARTAQLNLLARETGEEPAKYLFSTRELNQSILIKEVRADRRSLRYQFRNAVGTKIYLPYNPERPYDGGKSAFFDDPTIERILRDHAGMDVTSADTKIKNDLSIIRLLDEIPSLDPFLVKDKLRIEGIAANEFYFEISESEWDAIRAHVTDRLKPIIDFAFRDSEELQRGRTRTFINKLWETKDTDALMPIVKAFNLPLEEASGIFAAWKGIMYYDYEYTRCQADWTSYSEWLATDAVPIDFVEQERKQFLAELLGSVSSQFEAAWAALREIFSSYDSAYNTLFVERKDPAPFIDFMRKAVRSYWILGTKMSAINHSVSVWDTLTAHSFKRRIKYEQLFELLDLQREILAHS